MSMFKILYTRKTELVNQSGHLIAGVSKHFIQTNSKRD